MQACLYSPRGGFFSSRAQRISTHFGTSSLSHPAFGALIARQLEQMWHLLGDPSTFHVIEVGAGDGALAQSIVDACGQTHPALGQALHYVAADYAPTGTASGIHRVKTAGLSAFRNVVGCILSNELLDNFPVHRFAIRGGKVKEVFVTLIGDQLTEVLDEPSSPRIEGRLASLNLSLPEGFRGEVNLGLEDWTREAARVLERGFVLTIDYGDESGALYGAGNGDGTLVCYRQHVAGNDPYQHIGQQDITCHVDFTTLRRLGEQHGLVNAGCTPQRRFLTNLGFSSLLDSLDTQDLSAARKELSRMAMTALVDPEQYGDLKVLAQAKGVASGVELQGFATMDYAAAVR